MTLMFRICGTMTEICRFTIHGQPPSKSNCYKIIARQTSDGRPYGSLAKTKSLRSYEKNFYIQVPASARDLLYSGFVKAEVHCYYKSMRNDLDNALKSIFDCLQVAQVIKNDNKIVEILATKHVDKENPRTEIALFEAM